MLLGSACSEVTESLAKVVPYWNIVQVNGLAKLFILSILGRISEKSNNRLLGVVLC